MRVIIYPADRHGCGHHRLIWPAGMLNAQGMDVTVVRPEDRAVRLHMERGTDRVVDVECEHDVVVFQRLTNKWMAQAVPILRAKGIAVVVEVDDDLSAIHPHNPAFAALHPNMQTHNRHSWENLKFAARNATMITVSTGTLAQKYKHHPEVRVLRNYLAPHYFTVERQYDHALLTWPASLHSHPDDPGAVGNAVSRILEETGGTLHVLGHPAGVAAAFGLPRDERLVSGRDAVPLLDWPRAVAGAGIGIAPLADTAFNRAKSWLKPLEMSAVGVPWVASASHEYSALHADGMGLLATSPKTWYRQLKRLSNDDSLRKQISQAGKEAAQRYRLDGHVHLWAEAWETALRVQRA